MLVGASCQAAFIGSGFGIWGIAGLELLAGICVTGTFTLWETSLQEHVPAGALSRVSSYDYLTSAGVIPLGNVLVGIAGAAFGLHASLLGMSVIGSGGGGRGRLDALGAGPAARRHAVRVTGARSRP